MAIMRTNGILEFPVVVAAMNARTNRQRLQSGELSLATGLDGRYVGAAKKFPGFTELLNVDKTCVWMQYVLLQKNASSYTLRGFLVLELKSGTEYELIYHYYDESSSTWAASTTGAIWAGLTAASQVSVAGNGRYAYIGVKGSAPKVLYHGAGGLTVATMGCGASYVTPDTPSPGTANTGGVLGPGTYRVAYRYYNSNRSVFSGLAAGTVTITDTATTNKITLSQPGALTPATDGWTHVYLYRSMSVEVAGTMFDAGVLYLEKTITCTDAWGSVDLGTMTDMALVYQDAYDPWRDDVGLPPSAAVLDTFEGVTFTGSDTSTGTAVTQMAFSPLATYSPEVFPIENVHRWAADDGPVVAFTKPGDLLYAWTQNAAFRVAKLGRQIVITRLHGGRGLAGRGGVTAVGRDMLAMTAAGLMLVDGMQGNMQAVGAVERYVYGDDHWKGSLDTVVIRHDSAMGATFVVNTAAEEAFLLWQVTGAITMLEDCSFVWGTEGPLPTAGTGPNRAFWLTGTGRILYAADTGAKFTMFGKDEATVTLNGEVASSTAADNVTATAPDGWTDANLEGAYLYLWDDGDPTAAPQKRKISSVTSPTITVASAFNPAPAAGDRFTIMPVVERVRFWPVPHADVSMQDMGRKTVTAMGVHALLFAGPTDATTNPNAVWRIGMCRNLVDTPDSGSVSIVPMSADTSNWQRFAECRLDGAVLEPYLEHISAGTDFELMAVAVNTPVNTNRTTG